MRDHLLAIDNGTQSIRALIFDLRGNLVAKWLLVNGYWLYKHLVM